MDDNLIVLPDSDLIKKFTEDSEKKKVQPDILYVDGHIALPFFMAANAPDRVFDELETGPVTPDTILTSGVRLFNTAIYCQDLYNGERALDHFQQNLDYARKILKNIVHVKNKEEIEELKANKEVIGTFFLLENADVLADNYSLIQSLRGHGILTVGLTHIGINRLADGNAVMHSDGIKPEGREVVHVLLENNILIDVANLHPSCFWQLMDLIEVPCISSCTGIKERCSIPGNLDLEQAKQIFDRKGLLGITFNPRMLSADGEATVEDIFIHADTVVQKFGPDFVALGSDFCGFDKFTEGMENPTKISNLETIMSNHGYKREDIEKILGFNWLRIYEGLL